MDFETIKSVVGFATAAVTMAQMFTGVFVCKTIRERGSTVNTPSTPFVGGFVISALVLQFALLLEDSTMTVVNGVGVLLNIGYLMYYHSWSEGESQGKMVTELRKGIIFLILVLGYVRYEDPTKAEFRLGMIVTVVIILVVASPLLSLPEVRRTGSTECLPLPMIISGTVVSLHWLVYSALLGNVLLVVQNLIATVLCLVQLSLFLIYPRKAKNKSE